MTLRDMVDEYPHVESEAPIASLDLVSAVAAKPLFSALEEQVMALAAHDALATLEAPGIVERAIRTFFGLNRPTRALADLRLEALRRAIVVARHRRHLPDPMARALREQGYSAAQLRAIEARAIS